MKKPHLFLIPLSLWGIAFFTFQIEPSANEGLSVWLKLTNLVLATTSIVYLIVAFIENSW